MKMLIIRYQDLVSWMMHFLSKQNSIKNSLKDLFIKIKKGMENGEIT
nr:MAG TPA: hypothetical protein [Caudoviricetes sp.]